MRSNGKHLGSISTVVVVGSCPRFKLFSSSWPLTCWLKSCFVVNDYISGKWDVEQLFSNLGICEDSKLLLYISPSIFFYANLLCQYP